MPNERFHLGYDLRMSTEEEAEIMIYGYITSYRWNENDPDVTAKDFDKMLKDAKGKGAKKLTLRINSGGGSVYQAVAMRTMLINAGFDEIKVHIDGLCASAATLPAFVPGAHVSIGEGANLMIHNPRSGVWGTAAEMEAEADHLRRMEADFRTIYANRCGKTGDEVKAWMDAETWFSAQEAVDAGFCDSIITGAAEAAACVDEKTMELMRGIYAHVPDFPIGNNDDGNNGKPDGAPTANNIHNKEDEDTMEIKDITLDQLKEQNPELYNQIMQAGGAQESERIAEIDALTPAGYEEMAAEAKKNGTSAMDYHKQIVQAQKKKGEQYLAKRKAETEPAAAVTGGDPAANDGRTDGDELDKFAKEMAELAKEARASVDGGMY